MFKNSKKSKFIYPILSTRRIIFISYSVQVEYFLLHAQ